MEKKNYITMLVDLDSLLDTRLALLNKLLDDETLHKVLSESYYNRFKDQFEDIPLEGFKRLYDLRDKTLLKDTVITHIIDTVNEFISTMIPVSTDGLTPSEVRLLVNTFPYELTKEEESNLRITLMYLTKEQINVDFTHKPINKMTPNWLKNNGVSLFTLYHYADWIVAMSAENDKGKSIFSRQSCPEITLLTPEIVHLEETTIKDIEKITEEMGQDPFVALANLGGVYVDLKFTSVGVFSSKININTLKVFEDNPFIEDIVNSVKRNKVQDHTSTTKDMYKTIFKDTL